MDLQRMLREMKDLGRAMADPDIAPPDDEADGYTLTVSARDFSKATRRVVDEKLTFSAALLRAGEVREANRILAEVEHDVRNEEAALLERMNEVTAARAVKRAHVTRLRLVRLLATAMVGASLLGVSAMGMAVAGMFEARDPGRSHQARASKVADARDGRSNKKVMLGDVALRLSKKDLQTLRRLTSGSVDAASLERFLATDLELSPTAVDRALATVLSLNDPLATKVKEVAATTRPATDQAADALAAVKEKAEKASEQAASKPASETPEEGEEPEPGTTEDDDTDGEGGGGKGGNGDKNKRDDDHGDGDGDGGGLGGLSTL